MGTIGSVIRFEERNTQFGHVIGALVFLDSIAPNGIQRHPIQLPCFAMVLPSNFQCYCLLICI
jgi:hypothetical protein